MPIPVPNINAVDQPIGSGLCELHRVLQTVALVLMLVVLWSLTHRYLGLAGDAKLYAFQALSRIHPEFSHDLFLQSVGQDRYTVFSPLFAWCISLLGLHNAEMTLTILCKLWLFVAAWLVARNLSDVYVAFMAIAALIVAPSIYGGFDIFHYGEDWLTARSLAEALVVTAVAVYLRGFRATGLLIAVAAIFVHPLMALPGALLVLCLWAPIRVAVLGMVLAIIAPLCVALTAILPPSNFQVFPLMDPAWLEAVRARSLHLFLPLWSAEDWRLNARPFVSLTVTALAVCDTRVRKLSLAAVVIGAAGLAIGMIASLMGPVAILLQGQAWRWTWITAFIAVLLLAPTVLAIWRDEKCGPLCVILLLGGWTFTPVDGLLLCSLAVALWLIKSRISPRTAGHLRWTSLAVGVLFAGWVVANSWTIHTSAATESGRESSVITLVRDFVGLSAMSAVIAGVCLYAIRITRSRVLLTAMCGVLLALCPLVLRAALTDIGQVGASAAVSEFSAWSRAIPPGSNVLVVPLPMSASFAWFTLGRSSYLSGDQSSGVVFSRETTYEVLRRAAVAQPLWPSHWHLVAQRHTLRGYAPLFSSEPRPLTREILMRICRDPQLNFVVAKENVGFEPLPHPHNGNWKDWNLYDCRHVNSANPPGE
jgi:hypothetical protein